MLGVKFSAKTAGCKTKEEYKEYKTLHLEDIPRVEKDYIETLEDMEIKLLGGEKIKNKYTL